jgi:FAD/FMN-containing dehydrogenase
MDALRNGVDGDVLLPGDAGYDDARTVWNAMIDKRPVPSSAVPTAADVARAVGFAAEHHLLLAIKGGGHNIAGNAVCDGG